MGALNNVVPFSLITWGQVQIESGLASILNATTPLFTVALAHYLTRDERMTPGKLAGVALGVAGVAVLIGPTALAGLGSYGLGQVAVLGGALSYALAGIYGRRLGAFPVPVAAAGMLLASTAMMAPLVFFFEQPYSAAPGVVTWGAMVALALMLG